jgi:hypothetical protein
MKPVSRLLVSREAMKLCGVDSFPIFEGAMKRLDPNLELDSEKGHGNSGGRIGRKG